MFMWVLPIFFISDDEEESDEEEFDEEESDEEEQSEDQEEGQWSLRF